MGKQKVEAIRMAIMAIGADGEVIEKRGGRYDLTTAEIDRHELANKTVAELVGGQAKNTVEYMLGHQIGEGWTLNV